LQDLDHHHHLHQNQHNRTQNCSPNPTPTSRGVKCKSEWVLLADVEEECGCLTEWGWRPCSWTPAIEGGGLPSDRVVEVCRRLGLLHRWRRGDRPRTSSLSFGQGYGGLAQEYPPRPRGSNRGWHTCSPPDARHYSGASPPRGGSIRWGATAIMLSRQTPFLIINGGPEKEGIFTSNRDRRQSPQQACSSRTTPTQTNAP